MQMPLEPTWTDICLRLALTLIAGAIVGLNRGARGHAAGFRTTILVGLAACVAMIQANILMTLNGRPDDSYINMDLMRLPLGILTGVGFIGGGTILKRGELVTGVTTAATLWIITVIGLCFGGGQLILGTLATILAVVTLSTLKGIDNLIPRKHRARLIIEDSQGLSEADVNKKIELQGYHANFQRQSLSSGKKHLEFEIQWSRPDKEGMPSNLLSFLEQNFQVIYFGLTAEKPDSIS